MLSKGILAAHMSNRSEIGDISRKLCGQQFNCSKTLDLSTMVSTILIDGDGSTSAISPRSLNLRENLLFGRPLRKPKDSEERPECQKCEKKRRSCFKVSFFKKLSALQNSSDEKRPLTFSVQHWDVSGLHHSLVNRTSSY